MRYPDHFASLVRGETDTTVGAFAARLAVLDINSASLLVLSLLGEEQLAVSERDAILGDLESFLVRRMICGRPTKSYARKFLDLLRDFCAGGVFTGVTFRTLLARGSGDDVFDWPTELQFETAWNTIDTYRMLKPAAWSWCCAASSTRAGARSPNRCCESAPVSARRLEVERDAGRIAGRDRQVEAL